MKMCAFLRGMAVGMAAGVALDMAVRPSPKFRKTAVGKAVHRLGYALDEAVDAACSKLH